MALAYKFSPIGDGYAVEHIEFTQDDRKITMVNRFDSYELFTDEDAVDDEFLEAIKFTNYDPKKGIHTSVFGWNTEEEGERIKYSVKGDVDKDEKKEIIEGFEDMWESGVEDLGWEWSDRDVYYFGPIEVTDLRTGQSTVYGR